MSNHDEHKAEGKGQTYTKGWWAGVIGVLIIALGFVTIVALRLVIQEQNDGE